MQSRDFKSHINQKIGLDVEGNIVVIVVVVNDFVTLFGCETKTDYTVNRYINRKGPFCCLNNLKCVVS